MVLVGGVEEAVVSLAQEDLVALVGGVGEVVVSLVQDGGGLKGEVVSFLLMGDTGGGIMVVVAASSVLWLLFCSA